MTELFFKYKTFPYLFDTKRLKLFRLRGCQLIEINNPKTLRKVRLDSSEISRDRALSLALECEKQNTKLGNCQEIIEGTSK